MPSRLWSAETSSAVAEKLRVLRVIAYFAKSLKVTRYGLTQKMGMVWLPEGEKSVRICLLVSTQYTNVTERRTDTGRRHRPTLRIESRDEKNLHAAAADFLHHAAALP